MSAYQKHNKYQNEQINLHGGDVKIYRRGKTGIWQIKMMVISTGKYFRKSLKTRDQNLAIDLANIKYNELNLKRQLKENISTSSSKEDVLILIRDISIKDRLTNLFKRNYSVHSIEDIFIFNDKSYENKIDIEILQAFFKFRNIKTIILSNDILNYENGLLIDFIFSLKKEIEFESIDFYYLNYTFEMKISNQKADTEFKKICIAPNRNNEYLRLSGMATKEYKSDIVIGVSTTVENNFLNNLNLKTEFHNLNFDKKIESIMFSHIDDIFDDIEQSLSNTDHKNNNFLNISKNYKSLKNIPLKDIQEEESLRPIFKKAIQQHNCVFEVIYRMNPKQSYGKESVANFRYNLGKSLANSIPEKIKNEIDIIVPVPETGKYYAQGLADKLNKKYIEGLYKNQKKGRGFDIQDHDKRRAFLYSKLATIGDLLSGKSICLVDEAIFTGATLKVATNLVNKYDIKSCFIAIPSPPCVSQCPYDMMPDRNLLLEYQRKDNLAEYFNVEGVFFIEDNKFISQSSELNNFCRTCFS